MSNVHPDIEDIINKWRPNAHLDRATKENAAAKDLASDQADQKTSAAFNLALAQAEVQRQERLAALHPKRPRKFLDDAIKRLKELQQ